MSLLSLSPPIIIAIDGFSSCGKSTLAKTLAKRLGYVFIDTGAMYRAVTLYVLREQLDWTNDHAMQEAMRHIHIQFVRVDGHNHTILNGEDVEVAIRTPQVSAWVSEVSALPVVRTTITAQQQAMGESKGIVMEGRDIGTAVFPQAELKIFLTADFATRVERRWKELHQKGEHATVEEVAANLAHRDHLDSNRAMNPLRQAADALVLDNTHLTVEQQIDWIIDVLYHKFIPRD